MNQKMNFYKNILNVLTALLLLGSAAGTASATIPGLLTAKYISDTNLKMTFNITLDVNSTVDETKITVTNNSGSTIAVVDNSAIVVGNSLTITTSSVGSSTNFKIDNATQGLDLAADAVKDSATSDRNIESLNNSVADGQKPTFTAARTALNTIVLTFSEPVTGSAILDSFTVTDASSVTNTAPTANTTIILTTVGLTATNGTPDVGYNSTAGDIADNAATPNEIANGGAVAAADRIPPTFTAARTSLNTIVLTFSEPVTGSAILDSFTVAGASSVTNTAPATNTTIILTTVGLTATNGTPDVGYNATAGDIADNAATPNEIANGGAVAAADQIPPTFTAARTSLNTIVLTFSEPVTGSAILDSFTVTDASSVTNTAPSANTTIILTTLGLTATNGTPDVGYNATAGDIADNSAAQNEIANGGAVAAQDQVKPIVLAATLNYNTAILNITFSETIYANLTNASKFHLNNISGTNNVNLTEATTTVTNGTTLSFTLTQAQRYAAFNISGVNGGDGGVVVLDLEAAGVADLVNNTNDADLNNTVTETYTPTNTTAVITLNSSSYVSGVTATVSLNDNDMNTNINSNQTLTVNLTSTTNSTNLTLTLTETDVNTGIFNGTFTFGISSGSTTLGVSDGDTIYANYTDNDSVLRSTNATFNAVATKLVINSTTYGNLTDRNGDPVTPTSMVAGVATVFKINATDANGILDTGFTGTMTISVNGSGISNLTSYTFVAADNGTIGISVTDNVSETIGIYFNSTSVTTNVSTTYTVVPNKPYKLLFNNSMPLSTLTNSLQVNISVADAYNNLINASKLTGNSFPANAAQLGGTDGLGLGIKFNLSLSLPPPGSASVFPTSIVMDSTTVNTYVAYVNDSVDETITLKATAVFFSPAYITTNLSFMAAVSDILVTTNKTNNTANANSGANSLGSINISAQLRDSSGNALSVPGSVITFNSDSPTVLNVVGQTATTNASGIAIITISTTNIAGTAVITAQDFTGHEGMVTVTTKAIVDNANSELVVNPAARAGDNVTVYATLKDYAGTAMPAGETISFNITSGDSTSTLNSITKGTIVTAVTNSSGVATVIFRAANASAYTINATVVDEMGEIKRVGTSEKTITISPNDAAVLVVLPASKGLANIKGTNAIFNVTVYDVYNNVNTTGAIKVNVSTTDMGFGNMTVGSTTVNNHAVITTSSGIGSLLYEINSTTAGSATLTFAVYKNETGQFSGLLTNFTDSVFVTTSGATSVTITPSSTGAAVNTNITLTVNLTDNDGNLIGVDGTNMSLIPSGGSLSTSSLISAGGQASTNLTSSTAGDVTVTVYVEGLSPVSTKVTFSGNATTFVLTPENSSVLVSGTTNITIQAYDSLNNMAAIYNGGLISAQTGIIPSVSGLTFSKTSFTFNATGYAMFSVTSSTAGNYTIQAVALGLIKTTDVTFKEVSVLRTIIVSNASVFAGNNMTFNATTLDQYGDFITATVTWNSSNEIVGTINHSTGVFDGLVAGTTTITATNGSVNGTATATVTAFETPSLSVSSTPANVTAGIAEDVTFTVSPTLSGVLVILSGNVTTVNGTTDADGSVVIRVNATSSGIITATASKDGYKSNTTTITAQAAPEQEQVFGNDTVGIYRTGGAFYLKNSNSAGDADMSFVYGITSDTPLAGDWDASGTDTVGIYRTGGAFYLKNSNSAGDADMSFVYGITSDTPLVGDWDGNGADTVGIYRNGSFYLRNSNSAGNADMAFIYGIDGDIPIVGDWDGDGVDTVGIYRSGAFYLRNSNDAGISDMSFVYGIAGDTPLVGDWDGDGVDTVGIYRSGAFHLRNSNDAGNADLSFVYGIDSDTPLVGDWDGQ